MKQIIKLKNNNLIVAYSGDYEYRHDPEHRDKPKGGDWSKTQEGWSRKKEDSDKQQSTDNKKTVEKDGLKNDKFDLDIEQANKMDFYVQIGENEKKKFSEFKDEEKSEILKRLKEGEVYHDLKKPKFDNRKLDLTEIRDDATIDFGDGRTIAYGELKKDPDMLRKVNDLIQKGEAEHSGFDVPKQDNKTVEKQDSNYKKTKIYKNQLRPNTNVVLEDGTKKKYKDLTEDEKKTLHDAIERGSVSHRGLNDYSKVDSTTLNANIKNNLSKLENKKVKVREVSIDKPIDKNNVGRFNYELYYSTKSYLKKYDKILNKDTKKDMESYTNSIRKSIGSAIRDGSLSNVNGKDLDRFVKKNIQRILHQDIETRQISEGNHGVGHCVYNSEAGIKMLDELKNSGLKITGKDKLALLSVMANHDIGYTLGDSMFVKKNKHKEYSGSIAREERSEYEKIFGKDYADKICGKSDGEGWIQNHDDSDYDWSNNPVGSSIALADNTSMFGKGKVNDLFIRSGKAMKVCCAIRLVEENYSSPPSEPEKTKYNNEEDYNKAVEKYKSDLERDKKTGGQEKRKSAMIKFEKYKDQLKKSVEEDNQFEDYEKDMMKIQIDEIKLGESGTASRMLSRYSGRIDSFKYDKRSQLMRVNMGYSEEGQIIDSIFNSEIINNSFKRFIGDLNPQAIEEDKNSTILTKDGRKCIEMKIQGINKNGQAINKSTLSEIKDFKKNTARDEFLAVRRMCNVPNADKIDSNKAIKMMSDSRDKFDEVEWKRITQLIIQNKNNPSRLDQLLQKFGLTKKEQSYLNNMFFIPEKKVEKTIKKKKTAPERKIQDRKLQKVNEKSKGKKIPLIEKNKKTEVKKTIKPSVPSKNIKDKKLTEVKKKPEVKKKIEVKKKPEVKKKQVKKVETKKPVKKNKKKKSSIERFIYADNSPRRDPYMKPPREDLKVRYKYEDLDDSEKEDFLEVENDVDLKQR